MNKNYTNSSFLRKQESRVLATKDINDTESYNLMKWLKKIWLKIWNKIKYLFGKRKWK